MDVHPVPCLRDNYAYLVHASGSRDCVVVDPSEAAPVERALHEHGLALTAILNTHHHRDHVGGNAALVAKHPGIEVFAHASDRGRVPEQTRFLDHGDTLEVAGLSFEILHIPGHTMGAIAYVGEDVVFTGDTLFAGGCGRLFEGTPADMNRSLNEVLGRLPNHLSVYCGHEYTENNLRFASVIEPDNEAIRREQVRARAARERGQPTIPTTLGIERETNPFLRCNETSVRAAVDAELEVSTDEVFGRLRRKKDLF